MVKILEEKRKAVTKEVKKYYQILVGEEDSKQEIYRELAGAVFSSISNWCGNFVPEYNEIIITISRALAGEIEYINPGEAYYVGDYLMTIIMASEDMEDAKEKLYNIITGNRLHIEVQEHIAGLMGIVK